MDLDWKKWNSIKLVLQDGMEQNNIVIKNKSLIVPDQKYYLPIRNSESILFFLFSSSNIPQIASSSFSSTAAAISSLRSWEFVREDKESKCD